MSLMDERNKIVLPKYTSTPTGYDIEGVGKFPRVSNILECGKMDNGILDAWKTKVFKREIDSLMSTDLSKPSLIKTGVLNAYDKPSHIANQSAEFGSIMHSFMEDYLNEGKFKELPAHSYASTKTCAESMKKFVNDWHLSPANTFKAECLTWSTKYGYAGCVDYLAIANHSLFLLDWKTSNHISTRYFLQTSAYWEAVEERFKEWGINAEISGVFIIRFAKDKPFYEYETFNRDMKEKYFQLFKSCLNIYNFSKSDGKQFEVF